MRVALVRPTGRDRRTSPAEITARSSRRVGGGCLAAPISLRCSASTDLRVHAPTELRCADTLQLAAALRGYTETTGGAYPGTPPVSCGSGVLVSPIFRYSYR